MSYSAILVIKVGTSTLSTRTEAGESTLDREAFNRIARQAVLLQKQGYGIVIVSSAAITAGMNHTGTSERPSDMPALQRMASIGWRLILNTWAAAFDGHTVGELLVTKRELERPHESSELVRVIDQLLRHQDICIINENDALTHEEIAFGDNDTLAAHVAALLQERKLAEEGALFTILSDIDGVYEDKNNPATILREIDDIDRLSHLASDSDSSYGTGGMITKFQAAKIAGASGVDTWIGRGKNESVLASLLDGTTGTHFRSLKKKL